jgi:hypothetical protein
MTVEQLGRLFGNLIAADILRTDREEAEARAKAAAESTTPPPATALRLVRKPEAGS